MVAIVALQSSDTLDYGSAQMTSTGPTPASPAAAGGLAPRFAAGSLGMGVWVTVPGLLLLYFLTDVLAVPPLLAGFVLLAPKIVDVRAAPVGRPPLRRRAGPARPPPRG